MVPRIAGAFAMPRHTGELVPSKSSNWIFAWGHSEARVRTMEATAPTERTRVRRLPQRAAYDRETIYAILDTAFVCHVGLVLDGRPVVIPTAYARVDDA